MSELIAQICGLRAQVGDVYATFEQSQGVLVDLYAALLRLQSSDAVAFRQEINETVALLSKNGVSIEEPLLTLLLDYFIRLFRQWLNNVRVDQLDDSATFENLAILLSLNNVHSMNQALTQEFNECLASIASIGKQMFIDPNIRAVNHLLNSYISFESNNRYTWINNPLFDENITKCLCSPYTVQVFSQFQTSITSEERTPAETFVIRCHDYIAFLNRPRLAHFSLTLREHLLPSIADLVDTYAAISDQCSTSSIPILIQLTTSFLYSVEMTVPNDVCLDVQLKLTDSAIRVFSTTSHSIPIINNCVQYVYMGTQNDKILDHLKTLKLTPIMFELGIKHKTHEEIQFNVYRILAAIMTEEDIKRLDDPGDIAKVFLKYLTEIMRDPAYIARLKNLLGSLKILLQHDQIRDEVLKQNGLPSLLACATEETFDLLVRQRALQILLIMTFNDEACAILKQDISFNEYIQSLARNPDDPESQRAAQSLLWILNKEQTAEQSSNDEQKESKHTHDIMISYSHKDKDLCFQIHDHLIKDGYKVWLDRDQMHGSPTEAMANAIENAEFVFMCMSDSYKQSGYCKLEAHYALERQCSIIPLVMKSHFKADGWLGIIATGKMRIDFPKHGFDGAYKILLTEISRNRKESKTKGNESHIHHEIPSNSTVANIIQNIDTSSTPILSKTNYPQRSDHPLPSNIEQWTVDDVQQFFLKNDLQNFLPLCARMNGTRLAAFYQMCTSNSPTMFQSLNMELTAMNDYEKKYVLKIADFLQFLEDIKIYVPIRNEKSNVNSSQSSVCMIL